MLAWLVAAAIAGWGVLAVLTDAAAAAAIGTAAPLGAAAGTWAAVERTHRRAPEAVSALLIKLFAAKMLFFGGYVAAAVLLLDVTTIPFVASFTAQYILLHLMVALAMRRLFTA